MIQIEKIILYNKDGETRELEFHTNSINIITGKSKTGKSAIIDIIEYCFGHSSFKMPAGIIRNTVEWYAVLYKFNEGQLFVAKPRPEKGQKEQSSLMFKIGKDLETPKLDDLKINSSDDQLKEFIENKEGLKENINMPKENETRQPLSANLKHTHYYLFQNQTEVANKALLFHRQNEPFMMQAIKDTMKYFLGATSPELLNLLDEKKSLRRKLIELEKKNLETEILLKKEFNIAKQLLEEAKQIGLLDEIDSVTDEDIITKLSELVKIKIENKICIENDQIPKLQNSIKSLKKELKNITNELNVVDEFDVSSENYKKEVFEQSQRLKSVDLLDSNESCSCPLCNSTITSSSEIIQLLKQSFNNLNNNLQYLDKDQVKLNKYSADLKKKRDSIREKLFSEESNLNDLIMQENELKKYEDRNIKVSRVIGRISLYLDSLNLMRPDSQLQSQLSTAQLEMEKLNEQIEELMDDEKLVRIIDKINIKINEFKKHLEMEFQSEEFMFNFKHLTLQFMQNEEICSLKDMGSAENWLASHIVVLLSFHEYFIENNRPVPRFLILDQPSQVYFPNTYDMMEGNLDEGKDDEIESVKKLFDLLHEFVNKHKNFQIILFEHANISHQPYQDAIIEPRWDGKKNALIPLDWNKE
ncbi:MAG: DUF3732 domain-containing protein [Candidatus Woesearchaeota archaeon]